MLWIIRLVTTLRSTETALVQAEAYRNQQQEQQKDLIIKLNEFERM